MFLGLFDQLARIDLKIQGFDPQNPGFSPSRAAFEFPLLPPKTALERSPEISIVPKYGLWWEMGLQAGRFGFS